MKRARAEKKASEEIAVRTQKEAEALSLENTFEDCQKLTARCVGRRFARRFV